MDKIIKLLLGIFGFATVGIFVIWLILMTVGEKESAEEIRHLPSTIDEIKENVTIQTASTLTGAMVELNNDRKEAVAQEDDPYLKQAINWIYLLVFIHLGIAILALFGIKMR